MASLYSTHNIVTMGAEVGPFTNRNYLTPGVIKFRIRNRMEKSELFLTIRTNWFDLYKSINQIFCLFCVQIRSEFATFWSETLEECLLQLRIREYAFVIEFSGACCWSTWLKEF